MESIVNEGIILILKRISNELKEKTSFNTIERLDKAYTDEISFGI
jgi:hypothetical protein